MSPRRHEERPIENPSMECEMRQIHARLDSMQTTKRREPNSSDVNEAENE